MADIDEEDGYSDDDLDALPSHDFLKLQHQAFQSTQHQPVHVNSVPQNTTFKGLLPHPNIYPQHGSLHFHTHAPTHMQTSNSFQQPSSDYGDIDDEILDGELLDIPEQALVYKPKNHALQNGAGDAAQLDSWDKQRHAAPPQPQKPPQFHRGFQGQDTAKSPPSRHAVEDSDYHTAANDDEIMLDAPDDEEHYQHNAASQADAKDDLGTKVAELLREREALQQAVKAANDLALAKAGEISIVRANQMKTSKEHEKQIAALQKLHADAAAHQKVEIENARAERERIATENRFLKRDLIEETEKAKQLQRVAKGAVGTTNGRTVNLPKKGTGTTLAYRGNFRDGFDDDEIQAVSPSKIATRSKAMTPKASAKRKRKAVDDSPGQPLQLSQPKRDELPDAPAQVSRPDASFLSTQVGRKEDQRFQVTQMVLNHRLEHGGKRSFEALTNFAYPSQPTTTLSTVFLDNLASLGYNQDFEDFPAALGMILMALWSQCIQEKYYRPLYLLIDLVKLILMINPFSTAPHLVDELVLLTQLTADINVIPRFRRKPPTELSSEIDTNECLQILQLVACGCRRRREDIERFWRSMRFDFILMMLRNVQPIEDIELILTLLRTSTLEDSFAMRVAPQEADQSISEMHVIDRVSAMLIEIPKVAEGEEPYDAVEIAEMRLEVLGLMEKICDNKHGGEAMARNPFAIGRLVRVMNDELHALYQYKYGHEHRAELVNQSTRLLYHLTAAYSSLINMQEKLQVIPGGPDKYLIALTRLAFSEGIFFEQGIANDVVDCAHQMLEDSVTPEEAEALLEAFSSARK